MEGGSRINNMLIYFFGICLTILFILVTSSYISYFGVEMISFIEDVSEVTDNVDVDVEIDDLYFAYRISNGMIAEKEEIHHMMGVYRIGVTYMESYYSDVEELMLNTYSVVWVKILSMNTFYVEIGGDDPYLATIYTVEVVELLSGSRVPREIKIEVVDQGYSFLDGTFISRKYLPVFQPGEEWILFLTGKAVRNMVHKDIEVVEDLSNLYEFAFPLKLVNGSVYSLDVLTGYPYHLPASYNRISIEEFKEIYKKE